MDYGDKEDDDEYFNESEVFTVAQYWKHEFERFDEEGFGEVPVSSLEVVLSGDVRSRDEEEDEGWARAALRAQLDRLRDNGRDNVSIQEIVDVTSRKRSFSFRSAVSCNADLTSLGNPRGRGLRGQRGRGRRHEGTPSRRWAGSSRWRRKIWGMLFRNQRDRARDEADARTADTLENGGGQLVLYGADDPIQANGIHIPAEEEEEEDAECPSFYFPWLTLAVASVQIFFVLLHHDLRDWKSRLLLPCQDSEPWRYMLSSLIPLDMWEFAFFFLAHLASLLPLETVAGSARAAFLYLMGVFTCSILAIFVDCRSSSLRGHGGTVSAAFSLLFHGLSSSSDDRNASNCLPLPPKVLLSLSYLSAEVGAAVYQSLTSDNSVCHCQLAGVLSAAAFAATLLSQTSPPLRKNKLFLSVFAIYCLVGLVVVSAAAVAHSDSGCVFFRKKQVHTW